ncbi:MAG: DUF1673 family protein [Methanoregulaceae archaeon]
MTLAFIDTIGRYLGWCPHAQGQHRMLTIRPVDQDTAGSGGALPEFRYGRTNLYRMRILAFALCMTGVGFSLFATANGDRFVMLATGLVLASLLYLGDGLRYWELFREANRAGSANELDWKQVTVVRTLPIIGVALILGFVGAVLLGLVPGLSMLTVNGFLAGFAIIGWYHLATVVLWERRSGNPLYSNGNRIYTRGGKNASQ